MLTPETGQILRKAREARGLSIGEVSSRLRINAHYIQSMESGDLNPLPPGPYRKAFITEYARFLNIKIEDLQSTAASEERNEGILSSAVSAVPGVAKKMTQSAVKTTESAFKKVEEGVKDAVEEITARDLWEEADEVRKERLGIRPRPQEDPRISIRKKNTPALIPGEPAPPLSESRRARRLEFEQKNADEEYNPIVEEEDDQNIRPGLSRTTKLVIGLLLVIGAIVGYSIFSKKQQPIVIAPGENTSVKLPAQKQKATLPSKKDSLVTIAPSADSLIFVISAKDSVWVSISPDVGNGFRGKLAKGEVKRFSARDKYFIFLGNQNAVSMTLGGKSVKNLPTIPGSNIVVRNVILTRDRVVIPPAEQSKLTEKRMDKKIMKYPQIKKQIPSVKPVLPR